MTRNSIITFKTKVYHMLTVSMLFHSSFFWEFRIKLMAIAI